MRRPARGHRGRPGGGLLARAARTHRRGRARVLAAAELRGRGWAEQQLPDVAGVGLAVKLRVGVLQPPLLAVPDPALLRPGRLPRPRPAPLLPAAVPAPLQQRPLPLPGRLHVPAPLPRPLPRPRH